MGRKIDGPSTIYAIRCNVNGRVYVGRTQNLSQRIHQHWLDLKRGFKRNMRNPAFQADFDKFGEEQFSYHVLEEHVPPDKADEREIYWIAQYKATDHKHGYNTLGGNTNGIKFAPGLPPKPTES